MVSTGKCLLILESQSVLIQTLCKPNSGKKQIEELFKRIEGDDGAEKNKYIMMNADVPP